MNRLRAFKSSEHTQGPVMTEYTIYGTAQRRRPVQIEPIKHAKESSTTRYNKYEQIYLHKIFVVMLRERFHW